MGVGVGVGLGQITVRKAGQATHCVYQRTLNTGQTLPAHGLDGNALPGYLNDVDMPCALCYLCACACVCVRVCYQQNTLVLVDGTLSTDNG